MIYTYEFVETGEVIEINQSMKDDALTEYEHPETKEKMKVKRIITGGSGVIFKGDGWDANLKNRGYKGKYVDKLRPVGTEVDAPNSKREADALFQQQIDNGMLDGVEPSMTFNPNTKTKPQTIDQQMDPKYNPYK